MRTRFPVGVHNYDLRHNIFLFIRTHFLCLLLEQRYVVFDFRNSVLLVFFMIRKWDMTNRFWAVDSFLKRADEMFAMLFPDRSLAETNLNEFLLRKQLKLIFWSHVDQSYHIIGFNSFTTNAASPQRNSYVITVK